MYKRCEEKDELDLICRLKIVSLNCSYTGKELKTIFLVVKINRLFQVLFQYTLDSMTKFSSTLDNVEKDQLIKRVRSV